MAASAGTCDACKVSGIPLMKLSLGKDFFGRTYDRLSPSSDQSPMWFCEGCSMQKNLQRDFRDIRAEHDKLAAGQHSELSDQEAFQRATLRLREIVAILGGSSGQSTLLNAADVKNLIDRFQTTTMRA
ncbi:MAG: hypothetical protein P0111_12725 [Nitrospira sp.]|nr:hypothetical protein [Nitrospira sp.]